MTYAYRPAPRLTTIAICLAALSAAVAVVAAITTSMQLGTLETLSSGGAITLEQAEACDLRQRVIGVFELLVTTAEAVVFLTWVYRANCNARALGFEFDYSPGWSVGCFFVPIFNLWLPYGVVRDLWRTGTKQYRSVPLVWWLCLLLLSVIRYSRWRFIFGPGEMARLARPPWSEAGRVTEFGNHWL